VNLVVDRLNRDIRDSNLIKIVAAADARCKILIDEHIKIVPHKRSGYNRTNRLNPLARLTANAYANVHFETSS
jgi:hypothetical protein